MIHVIVIYDIRASSVRTRVADICLDYALDRQQYSVFTGLMKPQHLKKMASEIDSQVKRDGYVVILRFSADEWTRRIEIGAPIHAA
jgi:CRISPR-associated protein Cas2